MGEIMSEKNPKRVTHRSSLFWPFLLIAVGVLFLLNNLGIIQGNIWDQLVIYWPVIFIVIGLDSIYKGDGIVGAVVMLSIGGVFLLANLGYLAIDGWQVIIRLWPVLLIAIGIDILIGRRAVWLSLIGLVLVMAILAGGIWYFGVQSGDLINPGKTLSQPLNGIEEATIDLEPGVGEVIISRGSAEDILFSGTTPEGISTRENISQNGEQGTFSIQGGENFSFLGASRENKWDWDIKLSTIPTIDLKFGLGVGNCRIDLRGLKINALDISLGVGDALIILPSEGNFQAKIDGAIGQVLIYLPEGMGLRVKSNYGLGNFKAPAAFVKIGDYYQTKGFTKASHQVDLNISQAIGVITVKMLTP